MQIISLLDHLTSIPCNVVLLDGLIYNLHLVVKRRINRCTSQQLRSDNATLDDSHDNPEQGLGITMLMISVNSMIISNLILLPVNF